ncbi:MAG TPA: ABC transporter substrate-binding protein, partial [Pasteurellaceae bacterium]|nr:ABC transporter substrate-binding protein [Pasteurellaceae bacterium]
MKKTIKSVLITATIPTLIAFSVFASDLPPLNSDTEQDRIGWNELESKFGPLPTIKDGTKVGGVSKTLTNEYWRSLGEGYQNIAKEHNVFVSYQAAANEGDQMGQLSIAETMIAQGYDALLFSPQTDANLQPALEAAEAKGISVVNVNDAVIPSTRYYVGNVQKDNGVRVANWFIENKKGGGKVAVIEGQPGVFAA